MHDFPDVLLPALLTGAHMDIFVSIDVMECQPLAPTREGHPLDQGLLDLGPVEMRSGGSQSLNLPREVTHQARPPGDSPGTDRSTHPLGHSNCGSGRSTTASW